MDENENLTVDENEIDAAWAEDETPAEDGQGAEERPAEPPAQQRQEERPAEAEEPERFTLKNRDETRTVTRDELVAMAQKGWDYDTVRQERDQLRQYRGEADPALALVKGYAQRNGMSVEQYIDTVRKQELLAQGVSEQTAETQIGLEKQQAALREQNAEAEQARQRQEAILERARQQQEARKQGMLDFLKTYPGVKPQDIPREVWERVAGGESLVSAYTLHQNKRLEAELAAERQNKQNRQTTPGSLAASAEGDVRTDIDKWWYEDD